ncbi:YciI family protein [Brevibacillus migulae]|uniref:YciI family protein n=1 Tax=Brevibacillus migulae TaxID=1644114 RepID=UPI00106EEF21|nr:YciI family protein [Brevibacillus migulae]
MTRFLIITNRTPNFNANDIPGHYEHLENLKKNNRLELYGPFSDSTGGAYLIKAESFEEAVLIGSSDPLIKSGSSTVIVKEWLTK